MSRVLPLILLAILFQCTNLAPKYVRPEKPVADDWQAEIQSTQTQVYADLAWRSFYRDSQLQTLIERALQNNRDLRVAALNMERVRALFRIQAAEQLPQFEANGSASYRRIPGDLAGSEHGIETHQYGVNLGLLSYELDFFGKIQNLKKGALEQFLASSEAWKAAQISLVSQVGLAYVNLQVDGARLELAQKTLEAQQSALNLAQRRFELGAASALSVKQAQISVDSARVEIAGLNRQIGLDQNALELLIGQPLERNQLRALPIDADLLLTDLPAELSSEQLLGRPDIQRSEHLLKAANANIGAARAAFFPSIRLTASGGTASASLSNLFQSGSGAWSFVPQISVPIFTWGETKAKVKVAKVDAEIALSQYEGTIQTAFREVADGLTTQTFIKDQIQAQQALVATAQESLRLSQARFERGVDSFLNVLDAQRSLYAAQQGLLSVQADRLANHVRLYRALGGGWDAHSSAATAAQP
ncbi:MAG: efflux transporter outer membrane subunit [Acidobacteria bacterium]|nr:efflux transporter outer membrane subunit [Acidobacteriota bacterium]